MLYDKKTLAVIFMRSSSDEGSIPIGYPGLRTRTGNSARASVTPGFMYKMGMQLHGVKNNNVTCRMGENANLMRGLPFLKSRSPSAVSYQAWRLPRGVRDSTPRRDCSHLERELLFADLNGLLHRYSKFKCFNRNRKGQISKCEIFRSHSALKEPACK